MSSPPLTIRNLTSTATELKLIERYEAPQLLDGSVTIANVTKNFTSLMSNIKSPTSPELATKAETFINKDVSIPIGPFEEKTTDIRRSSNEMLRLTFETEGQRYRVDTPTPSQRSTVLAPLAPDPHHEYTAVYLPKYSYIALFSSAKLESWMSKIKNEAPLSALSIPGTHNSPTCHTALPSV